MRDLLPLLLLALSGFLAGGAYAMWKSSRLFAVTLATTAVLALVGGVLWWS
ncbi:hypothetical protein [Actinopolyspora mortivallis]|uniref:hypothetical protein n=1 Tax=Actinopolyspora mortivallis TaxID=33906 RepID=UPI0003635010|nr:hypothetical protein [Actinopolyspora mortivallis]